MSNNASLFRPDDIIIDLGDNEKYRLVYDLNSFCEMEKIYDSVDTVIQMLFGSTATPDLAKVTYCKASINPDEVEIDGVPLTAYISKVSVGKTAKYEDSRNLLWLGCIHDYTVFDEYGDVKGYTISKAKLGTKITLKNIKEINAKILMCFLRDLLPKEDDSKNVEQPEEAQSQETKPPVLTVNK